MKHSSSHKSSKSSSSKSFGKSTNRRTSHRSTSNPKPNKVHQGHHAKKRFGQNFLIDQNIIQAIVSAINPKNSDNLIEIGPGLGALTEPVAQLVDHFTVIEVDNDLIARLKVHPTLSSKLTIEEGDVLSKDFSKLASLDNKAKVFGNLPYNISTPLIIHLIKQKDLISNMTFMLQKEVVDRIGAVPNSKQFGRLSLIVQYFCDVYSVIDVPPESFVPPPKVQSAVIQLVPKSTIKNPVKDIGAFETVTSIAFSQRRKTVRNSLSRLLADEDWSKLEELGISSSARAENLSLNQFVALTNYIIDNNYLDKLREVAQVEIDDNTNA